MPSTPSDMLCYYHQCLLEKLQTMQDYNEVRGKKIAASLTSAVIKLKASVKVLLDAVPGKGSEDSITVDMIATLHTNLATVQSEWKTQAGEPRMLWNHRGNVDVANGEDNLVIYEVTELMNDCLIYVENIKTVLPKARAQVLVGGASNFTSNADMHAMRGLLAEIRTLRAGVV